MIGLNDLLLRLSTNMQLWICGCIGVAIIALLLILCCKRFPKMNKVGPFVYAGTVMLLGGGILIYGGVRSIFRYRRIFKDDVRVTGVVTRMQTRTRSKEPYEKEYRFIVAYTDERGARHECRTAWSRPKEHVVSEKIPVAYYRHDPAQAILDPSWKSYTDPGAAVVGGVVLLIASWVPLRRAKRLIKGEQEEESPPDPEMERERAAQRQFRIACRNVLADGKATVDEKQKLKMLAKHFDLSSRTAKEIVRDEVRTFRQKQRSR